MRRRNAATLENLTVEKIPFFVSERNENRMFLSRNTTIQSSFDSIEN